VEISDGQAEVRAHRVDVGARRGNSRGRGVDEMQLLITDAEPVAVDAGDVRPGCILQPEQVSVELDERGETRTVRVHRGLRVGGAVHGSSGVRAWSRSMNSSRMPPGAETNAIRRRPKAPSTSLGPQTISCPSNSPSRSSVNSAG